jgi:hypothetical protein
VGASLVSNAPFFRTSSGPPLRWAPLSEVCQFSACRSVSRNTHLRRKCPSDVLAALLALTPHQCLKYLSNQATSAVKSDADIRRSLHGTFVLATGDMSILPTDWDAMETLLGKIEDACKNMEDMKVLHVRRTAYVPCSVITRTTAVRGFMQLPMHVNTLATMSCLQQARYTLVSWGLFQGQAFFSKHPKVLAPLHLHCSLMRT